MEFKEKQAIYLQIADYICDNILNGKYPAEEKILSVRDIAVKLEVNPNTAMRAYDILQQQDIISNKRGIGFFVTQEAKDIIIKVRKKRFFETQLPEFFNTLKLLKIDINEIIEKYEE
ncbi:GntR family transcriptional regulator [Odoribacter sp. OttesenSCG-928-L07]|nr:GntR family transcriptional regulator [Odoribacter sp. OttesenSCG-928-L07]MDL2239512.1 GntR family transcriptional regulator [Bacteroidales bacterium OttesenSCG-928-L14]